MLPLVNKRHRAHQNQNRRQQHLDACHVEWTELINRGTFDLCRKYDYQVFVIGVLSLFKNGSLMSQARNIGNVLPSPTKPTARFPTTDLYDVAYLADIVYIRVITIPSCFPS